MPCASNPSLGYKGATVSGRKNGGKGEFVRGKALSVLTTRNSDVKEEERTQPPLQLQSLLI